jgi:hypothetical protein
MCASIRADDLCCLLFAPAGGKAEQARLCAGEAPAAHVSPAGSPLSERLPGAGVHRTCYYHLLASRRAVRLQEW